MDGYIALSKTVNQIITAARVKSDGNIKRGKILSDTTVVIDGKGYSYTMAVDINVVSGQYVWCELCNGQAIIVGA